MTAAAALVVIGGIVFLMPSRQSVQGKEPGRVKPHQTVATSSAAERLAMRTAAPAPAPAQNLPAATSQEAPDSTVPSGVTAPTITGPLESHAEH